MKAMTLILAFLSVINFSNNEKPRTVVLYTYEKGTIKLDEDFLTLQYDLDYYRRGKGDVVELYVFSDKRIFIGSVDEKSFEANKSKYLKEYESMVKSRDSDSPLRIERKNKRVFFFYYERLVSWSFGHQISECRYCIGGHNASFQIKESYFNVALFLNGKLTYAAKVIKDDKQNFTKTIDMWDEYYRQIPR